MPIGIITNVSTVVVAGLLGGALGRYFPRKVVDFLREIFGFCSLTIGISAMTKMNSLTIVIISVLLGSIVGVLCRVDAGITKGISAVVRRLCRGGSEASDTARIELMCMMMAVVCFSGTGIFGALSEGLDGDSSILMAKSVMDFFCILIFSVELGYIITIMAAPQLVIFLVLFFAASALAPVFTAESIANFKATGGVLTVVIGYNLIGAQNGWKSIKVLNMIPALMFALLLSWLSGHSFLSL